ncbi:MAG: alpha/beta hydrolase [Gammaproteobacteria bacterium]|nr:alpha/beta hydrolase [Gammaproteobacteria bacterium]MDD9894541.1 alpha/beta hydrolase [Gammaproteobacteria bacterium]MDD9957633.1 alpha/beta hydrolase [Gammaproteobacteria bacterium]
MKIKLTIRTAQFVFLFSFASVVSGQSANRSFVDVTSTYSVIPNLVYQRAGGADLKLDVYRPRDVEGPNPTLMYIHGGGWTNGSKEGSALTFLPYLEMGWTVVNVAYRLADVAHAPAAVEDTRCALRWIYRNAEQYGFDKQNIVVTGNSAGGHLALTTGMLTADVGMERQCPGDRMRSTWNIGPRNTETLAVAAIVNWYGITNVSALLNSGPGTSGNFTEAWLGSSPNRVATAARVSPVNHVRQDLPPIISIHGDEDSIVPYSQGVQLHEALNRAEVPNELITIEGGGHGGFSPGQMAEIYAAIRAFLDLHKVGI